MNPLHPGVPQWQSSQTLTKGMEPSHQDKSVPGQEEMPLNTVDEPSLGVLPLPPCCGTVSHSVCPREGTSSQGRNLL